MVDDELRRLERAARRGDPSARERLLGARARLLSPEEALQVRALWADVVGALETANENRRPGRLEVHALADALVAACERAGDVAWAWTPGPPPAEGERRGPTRALVVRDGERVVVSCDRVRSRADAGDWDADLDRVPATFAVPGSLIGHRRRRSSGTRYAVRLRLLDGSATEADLRSWASAPHRDPLVVRVEGPPLDDDDGEILLDVAPRVLTTRAVALAWASEVLV